MNLSNACFYLACGTPEQLPAADIPEICFCGRSNVGKSSLINRLLGRKSLARVSSTPGKTATANFFTCGGFYLVDLPGYGYAKVTEKERLRWDALMNAYFGGGRNIAVCFVLLDVRRTLSGDDRRMADFLISRKIPFAAVLTKCDKLNKTELAGQLCYWQTLFKDIPLFPFSAISGEGKEKISDFIERKVK